MKQFLFPFFIYYDYIFGLNMCHTNSKVAELYNNNNIIIGIIIYLNNIQMSQDVVFKRYIILAIRLDIKNASKKGQIIFNNTQNILRERACLIYDKKSYYYFLINLDEPCTNHII